MIVYTLISQPGAKCVYVAPYRALVQEVERAFLSLLNDLGYRVSSIIGNYETDDFEELLFRDTDVLVITPEKLDLILRAHPEFMENVRLFVLDEGQIVDDPKRGVKFELLLTRLKRKLPQARFLFISAVIPQETLEDFASWFNANIVDSLWRPSIQRYAKFSWKGRTGVLRYVPEEEIQMLHEFVPGIIQQHEFEYQDPQTGRRRKSTFPKRESKPQVAAELAFKFAELGPVLIFCSQTNFVEAVGKALYERLKLSLLNGLNTPAGFRVAENTRSSILAKEWLGETHLVTSLLKCGIAIHHGKLPEIVRTAIEADFRQKKLCVIIATNTLAQGVNLPIRTVIVHSCSRYVNNEWDRIPARDFWNIAGRAGRAGEETEGLIVHVILNERDEDDFKYYLQHRQSVEPVRGALFKKIINLIQGRLTEEAFKADIDPEILALLAEEDEVFLDDILQELVGDSLVWYQANRRVDATDESCVHYDGVKLVRA